MSTISTTYRLISTYADPEPWKEYHDRAILCRDIEETIAWGIYLFRDLSDLEARFQARVFGGGEVLHNLDRNEFERAYRLWVTGSMAILREAEGLAEEGFPVNGLDEFRGIAEEARCQIELFDLEPEIRPIEEVLPLIRPENPRPARYGT
jgi:hypothetical protein